MTKPVSHIYLLGEDAEVRGPFRREQLILMLREGQARRSDPAWEAGLAHWDSLENILFKNCRGIDRLAYLGLVIALIAYFVIMYNILAGWKINLELVVSLLKKMTITRREVLYPFFGVNTFGCFLAGMFLIPRLSHMGLRRWWAIVGAIPVIGWPLQIMGLLAPRGYAEVRNLPYLFRAKKSRLDSEPVSAGREGEAPEGQKEAKTATPPPPSAKAESSMPPKLLHLLKWTAIGAGVTAVLIYSALYVAFACFTMKYFGDEDLGSGNIAVPSIRSQEWGEHSDCIERAFVEIAGRDGIDAMISRLALGRDIEGVNQIMQAMPVGDRVGSGGNWDFKLCELSLLLYSFGDRPEMLYPETVDHIVNVLMTEKGGDPVVWTPDLFGLPLEDTENHVLQTESSRYLTNQWIARHGDSDPKYDNLSNGLEAWLLDYLRALEEGSIHEYNSIPYAGYTMRALVNLESFATSEPVAASARRILDRMNWEYALGSLSLRQYPPICRGRVHATDLRHNYEYGFMAGWLSLHVDEPMPCPTDSLPAPHHLFWTGLTDYRLPDAVANWARAKPVDYFVQIGHGSDSSPEIYSGGPGYMISAGGATIDLFRGTLSRPTVLLLEDGVHKLEGLLHVAGPSQDYRNWNNTGVYERFAVAAGPVHVPSGWEPAAVAGEWSVYEKSGQRIGVYSSEPLGIFCLLPEGSAADLARELADLNPDADQLAKRFHHPGGTVIEYDPTAPADQWVILSIDGAPVDRNHQAWPLMQGKGFPPEFRIQ